MALSLVTAPAVEPITLTEAKAHLKVDSTDEDVYLTALITSVREYCEDRQGRAYLEQTWDLTLDGFPSDRYIPIPLPPLRSVTSLKYIDSDGTEQTWGSANYIVDTKSQPGRVALAPAVDWPVIQANRVNAVTVRFVAGEGTKAADVPFTFKHAMYLILGHWYVNREDEVTGTVVAKIRNGSDRLLGLSQSHRWGA